MNKSKIKASNYIREEKHLLTNKERRVKVQSIREKQKNTLEREETNIFSWESKKEERESHE